MERWDAVVMRACCEWQRIGLGWDGECVWDISVVCVCVCTCVCDWGGFFFFPSILRFLCRGRGSLVVASRGSRVCGGGLCVVVRELWGSWYWGMGARC
jgi:hypothetical protein